MIVGDELQHVRRKGSTEIVGTIKTIESHETLRLRCGKAENVMHANGKITANPARIDLN